jgi:hypothetical protein
MAIITRWTAIPTAIPAMNNAIAIALDTIVSHLAFPPDLVKDAIIAMQSELRKSKL